MNPKDGMRVLAGIMIVQLMAALLGLIIAFPLMWCWNAVAAVVHLGTLTYWQSWCILFILAIIRAWSFKITFSESSRSSRNLI